METVTPSNQVIPPALLEQVQALAEAEHRPASDVVRDAIEGYLQSHPLPARSQASRAEEAGKRILQNRSRHPLPEGTTIREMMEYGRA